MKKLNDDIVGSIYGVVVFVLVLGFTGFLVLLGGHILEPFFSIMKAGMMRDILLMIWPNGFLLGVLFIMGFTTLMYYQKKYYKEDGGE